MKLVYDLSVTSLKRRASPSAFSLDFSNGIFPSNLATFSRSSAGAFVTDTGLVGLEANDVPRFDFDPFSGAALGLLVETSATNELLYSQDFTQPSWAKYGVSAGSGFVAPDGSTAACKIVQDAGSGIHRVAQNWPTVSGQKYTQSVWLKAAGARYVYINVHANIQVKMTVDLQTGAYVSAGAAVENPMVVQYPNDWWYVSVTGTGTGQTGNNTWFQINNALTAGDNSFLGNGTDGFLIWGAQLEAGLAATSYIETGSTTATRAADFPGLNSLSGTYDVTVTYDDLSVENLPSQTITSGWWPTQTRPHIRSIDLT